MLCNGKKAKKKFDELWSDTQKAIFKMTKDGLVWVEDRGYGIPFLMDMVGFDKATVEQKMPRIFTLSQLGYRIDEVMQEYYRSLQDGMVRARRIRESLQTYSENELIELTRALDGDLPHEELKKINPSLYDDYKILRKAIDDNAKLMVDNGLLQPEAVKEHYVTRMYEQHMQELKEAQQFFHTRKHKRKNLSEEERIALNQIKNASYVVPITLYKQRQQIALGSLLKSLADNFGIDEYKEGYVKIDNIDVGGGLKRFGALSGKFVPKELRDSLMDLRALRDINDLGAIAMQNIVGLVDHIKVNVTVKNPSTHLMNILSNVNLAYLNGDLSNVVSVINMALTDRKRFESLVDEAISMGLKTHLDEINPMYDALKGFRLEEENATANFKNIMRTIFGNFYMSERSATGRFVRDAYAWEDAIFKVGSYYGNLKKGMSKFDAFKEANYIYVDYASPMPNSLKLLDKIGITPFLHYIYKSTPATIYTITKSPANMFRFILLGATLKALGWSAFGDIGGVLFGDGTEDDFTKPHWASTNGNLFLAKTWARIGNTDYHLNVDRFLPGGKFNLSGLIDGRQSVGFGFWGALYNIANRKTPLGYSYTKKDDEGFAVYKKMLQQVAETYMPSMSPFGRYAIRLVEVLNGEKKNYYDEVMEVPEYLERIIGIRKFNMVKEANSRLNKLNIQEKEAREKYKNNMQKLQQEVRGIRNERAKLKAKMLIYLTP